MYQPGLHIIATLKTQRNDLLSQFQPYEQKLQELINTYELKNLGDVFHQFDPGGFTAVSCLSESHISIHTWPEYEQLNMDIYLSNFQRVNNGVVESLFNDLVAFFEAQVQQVERIIR